MANDPDRGMTGLVGNTIEEGGPPGQFDRRKLQDRVPVYAPLTMHKGVAKVVLPLIIEAQTEGAPGP
jgi:hypothetical protein